MVLSSRTLSLVTHPLAKHFDPGPGFTLHCMPQAAVKHAELLGPLKNGLNSGMKRCYINHQVKCFTSTAQEFRQGDHK